MISFLHPALLAAGAACVALPILIHLLTRRRRKTVRWGAMRFLAEAYRKQRRRLQMEQWLLLATRCLLIGLIGFALARPMFAHDNAGAAGGRAVILAIDNSLASTAMDDAGRTALDRHKAEAKTVLAGLDPMAGDRVGLIELGGPARAAVLPPSADIAAVGRLIDELRATDSAADVRGLAVQLSDLQVEGGRPTLVLLSDWRGGSAQTERSIESSVIPNASLRVIASAPSGGVATNVGISDLKPPRSVLVASNLGPADLSNPARVSLIRTGNGVSEPAVSQVTVWLESLGGGGEPVQVGSGVVRWDAGQAQATLMVPITGDAMTGMEGSAVLRASVDRDVVGPDNVRRTPIEMRDRIRAGIVAPARFGRAVGVSRFEAADWVKLALKPSAEIGSGIDVIELDPGSLDRPRVAGLDAAIVLRPDLVRSEGWAELAELVARGGLLVVTPAAEAPLQSWVDSFREAVGVEWTIGREATELSGPPSLAEPSQEQAGVLHVLAGELGFLAEAVHVQRALPVQGFEQQQEALATAAGVPVLLISGGGTNEAATGDADAPVGAERQVDDHSAQGRPTTAANGRERQGLVALMTAAFDPTWTDLPAKPMMVPLMQELVRQGVAQGASGHELTAGAAYVPERGVSELAPTGDGPKLRAQGEGVVVRQAGVWRALTAEGSPRGIVVANADSAGGDMTLRTPEQVSAWLKPLAGGGEVELVGPEALPGALAAGDDAKADEQAGMAWVILVAACALAGLEMFFARFASHAQVDVSLERAA